MSIKSLKEAYSEYFLVERFDGILYRVHDAIVDGNWTVAGSEIEEARRQKIPEGMIQDTIHKAFTDRQQQEKEKKTQLLSL